MAGPSTTIHVGPVLPVDSLGRYNPSTGHGTWVDYLIMSRYEGDPHVYMMGVTSPNGFVNGTDDAGNPILDTVSFCQLASKTLIWIMDWTASKSHEKPDIPDPTSNDPNWVLLDDWYEPAQEVLDADGQSPLWRISGTYIYGHRRPNAKTILNVNFPRPPWMKDYIDRTISTAVLKPGLSEVLRDANGNVILDSDFGLVTGP